MSLVSFLPCSKVDVPGPRQDARYLHGCEDDKWYWRIRGLFCAHWGTVCALLHVWCFIPNGSQDTPQTSFVPPLSRYSSTRKPCSPDDFSRQLTTLSKINLRMKLRAMDWRSGKSLNSWGCHPHCTGTPPYSWLMLQWHSDIPYGFISLVRVFCFF